MGLSNLPDPRRLGFWHLLHSIEPGATGERANHGLFKTGNLEKGAGAQRPSLTISWHLLPRVVVCFDNGLTFPSTFILPSSGKQPEKRQVFSIRYSVATGSGCGGGSPVNPSLNSS